ncbi:MAG: WD40 repeat domain-containing protein, partial [Bacillota bacterium]
MRRVLVLLVAALVLAAALPLVRAGGLPPLIWAEDHYLDLSKTDSARTTALVDTSPPGLVVLPREWGRVALHPAEMSLVAVVPGQLRGYGFDGSRLVRDPRLDVSFPGVVAVAFSSDGRFLAAVSSSGEVRVWGRDANGVLRQLASLSGFAGAVALEPARGADFWVVASSSARYLGFDGSSWHEVSAFRLAFSGALWASWYAPRGVLAVVDA